MATVKHETTVNGVDVPCLTEAIHYFREEPGLARFQFRVRNRWIDRGRNRSEIKNFHAVGQEDVSRQQPFIVDNDEPQALCGSDEAPNPVEYVLHALAGCLTTAMVYHAACRGIHIESVESELEGDLDVRGLYGVSDKVPKGYQAIRVKLRVKSDATAEQLEELAKFSPVYDTLIRPVPVEVWVEKV